MAESQTKESPLGDMAIRSPRKARARRAAAPDLGRRVGSVSPMTTRKPEARHGWHFFPEKTGCPSCLSALRALWGGAQ